MAGEVAKSQDETELREFAETGGEPEAADLAFRERLRERLWKIVRRQLGREPADREPPG